MVAVSPASGLSALSFAARTLSGIHVLHVLVQHGADGSRDNNILREQLALPISRSCAHTYSVDKSH